MKSSTRNISSLRLYQSAVLLLAALSLAGCAAKKEANNSTDPTVFATPETAGQALQAAAKAKDESALARILGPKSKDILSSGDPAEDQAGLESFVNKYERMNRWVTMTDGSMVLYIGADNYPYPIPLARDASSQWHFNTAAGEEEILARQIGRNELLAIDACSAIANAEELYQQTAHDDRPAGQYTSLILSSPGKHDGLHWSVPEGQDASPLGRLSVFVKEPAAAPAPDNALFDGYLFRILTAQGDKAKGGAKTYIVNGKMVGGFAILATPVKYQDSGIMTFLLSREGVVYQKDLGKDTSALAASIKEYNPTEGWQPAE